MSTTKRRRPSLRTLAIACAVLVLAITSLSAFIRLSRAGLGCEPWPQCYGQHSRAAADGTLPPPTALVASARVAHRVTASVALLLIIAMVMATLAATPMRWREGRLVLALLVLALFLAVLGRWTADSRLPAVVLGNLLAGFAMVAVSWRLVAAASPARAAPSVAPNWVRLAIAVVVAQVALGGLVSAGYAGLSCPQLAGCDLSSGAWQAFDPWREPGVAAADPLNRPGALVHGLHRAGAWLVAAVVVPLGWMAWRRGHRAGAPLVALVAAQGAAGAALVLAGLPLALALVHNIGAALLLATLCSMLPQPERRHREGDQENVSGSPAGLSAR